MFWRKKKVKKPDPNYRGTAPRKAPPPIRPRLNHPDKPQESDTPMSKESSQGTDQDS